MMTTNLSVAELAYLVTAVPDVRAIESRTGSTLGTIGSRIRQQDPQQTRFGVIIEEDSNRAIVEIGTDGSWPAEDIMHDVQETIIRSPSQAGEFGDASRARGDSGVFDVREQSTSQVMVRVQPLLQALSPQQTNLVQALARDDVGASVR